MPAPIQSTLNKTSLGCNQAFQWELYALDGSWRIQLRPFKSIFHEVAYHLYIDFLTRYLINHLESIKK